MQKTDEVLKKLLNHIEKTEAKELGCDEVYALLDQYSEAAQNGQITEQFMPRVQQHFGQCQDCYEEYDALLRILKSESAKFD